MQGRSSDAAELITAYVDDDQEHVASVLHIMIFGIGDN